MEMCPYCGEEIPQDSGKCWKCGAELTEGAARSEGDELEVPEDEDDEEGAGAPQVIECPFCGSPVAKKSRRCRECGRTVQQVKSNATAVRLWKFGSWAVVMVVGISTAAAVVLYSKRRAVEADRIHSKINASFDTVNVHLQPFSKTYKEERRREVWENDFYRKFVDWSDGVVDETPVGDTVKVAYGSGDKKVRCKVTFIDEQELHGLNVGEKIEYSARLFDYGKEGFAFVLTDGRLDSPKLEKKQQ